MFRNALHYNFDMWEDEQKAKEEEESPASPCSDLLGRIEEILAGIDRDEGDEDGWWPTSTGVSFGRSRLEEIRKLFEDLNDQGLPPAANNQTGLDT